MLNNDQNQSYKQDDQLAQLDALLDQKKHENKRLTYKYLQYQREFNQADNFFSFIKRHMKNIIGFPRSFVAYALGRRNLKRLYSRSYKRKDAANRLKPYIYHLYNLGFVEKTLAELKQMVAKTTDRYLQQAIAWELALWHANQATTDDAIACLQYLDIAADHEKNHEQLRKIAILQAESYSLLQESDQGKQVIKAMLQMETHPDLYLAMANLEADMNKRLEWINKAFVYYDLQPITFHAKNSTVTYDDLQTLPTEKKVNHGPKVSIILPAYNYETGIQIAIESILKQTWTNLELIVVDDCSTDHTTKVVKEYMLQDDRIKLFSTPINSGPYVARNIGLREATGEFVTVNDADDWSHAEKIEIQARHLVNHPDIIANTSEHARLTEDLKFYRRGTPGRYIFSNMSSLMFRRELVLEKIGYWDSVRFAADGEFKRRLVRVFGQDKVVDLKTGPLSLPKQSKNSLTGSSAFGYAGYFMGARKEYVESFSAYHRRSDSLYYSFPMETRPFPVPMPMLPRREQPTKWRHMDIVIASDFRIKSASSSLLIEKINIHQQLGFLTGLMQISCYNMSNKKELDHQIRNIINGQDIHMLVYGEKITCDILIINNPTVLQEKQVYLPHIQPKKVIIVIDELPLTENNGRRYHFRDCAKHVRDYFGKQGNWFACNREIYDRLNSDFQHEIRFINLSSETWMKENKTLREQYESRLDEWMVDDNPYL